MPDKIPVPPNRWTAVIIIALVIVLLTSGSIAFARYQPARPVEITLPTKNEINGTIQISGGVTSPGIYPFKSGDSVSALLDAAGGLTNPDASVLKLNIESNETATLPQKININTADIWLIQALPGIGEVKARAIVSYRETNGAYKYTSELMRVAGIGQSLYDEIKDLITVGE